MTEWEYRKIELNQHRPRGDALDMLNDAGKDGWELIGITGNNVAYLKRESADAPSEEIAPSTGAGFGAQDVQANGNAGQTVVAAHEVKVKYRDPETNETWTGRGRMANWLKRKQDAGENIDDYLV